MNSLFARTRIIAVAIGGIALAACNAVEDVRDEPTISTPSEQAVLQGTIKGLGTRRPVILQNNGQDSCIQPKDPNNPSGDQVVGECRFFGVLNKQNSAFSFGALQLGTPYSITVKKSPFAKLCTVTSGATGTVGAANAAPIEVTCADDPAIPHYSVTVSIAPAAAAKPGLKLVLTTENGAWEVPATGLPSYTFSDPDGYLFNSQFGLPATQPNLPVFGWRVTATVPSGTPGGTPDNCNVTGGPVTNTGGNIGDDGTAAAAPTGNVTGIQVLACGFQVRAQAEYTAATGQAALTIPAGDGVTLLLRQQPSGADVATVKVTNFNNAFVPFAEPDAQGNPTATPHETPSNSTAFYEVVIRSSPAGMACMPGNSGSRAIGVATDAGAVLLIKPASVRVAGSWIVDRAIRCRAIPVEAKQLRGVYQQISVTTATSGTPPVSVTSTTTNRNFLAFFEDGTYLFGAHTSSALSSGVEQGFYDYNNTAGTITFTAYTDTSAAGGLNNAAAAATLTGVVRSTGGSPKRITGTLSGTTPTSWVLTEVGPDLSDSTANPLDGAWVTWDTRLKVEDRRRVFIYTHGRYQAFHMGVNGIGNAQDACYVGNAALSGQWVRQGARSGCSLPILIERSDGTTSSTGLASMDVPNPTTVPVLTPGFPGKWPQSADPSYTDGRPYSPVDYELRPAGTVPADPICPGVDKLTVWDTKNGTRLDQLEPAVPPIVLCRITAN